MGEVVGKAQLHDDPDERKGEDAEPGNLREREPVAQPDWVVLPVERIGEAAGKVPRGGVEDVDAMRKSVVSRLKVPKNRMASRGKKRRL
jgi:hypothetical protein